MPDLQWPGVAGLLAFIDLLAVSLTILWALTIKREPTSAIAWCLLIFFLPVAGILLFIVFGYQSIHRPLRRKKKHAREYRSKQRLPVLQGVDIAATPPGPPLPRGGEEKTPSTVDALGGGQISSPPWQGGAGGGRSDFPPSVTPSSPDFGGLAALAEKLGAAPLSGGNQVTLYHDGAAAYDAMLEAVAQATHHIHMEFFITRGDESGRRFMTALAAKAKAGVEVRFLYDAVGSWRLRYSVLKMLTDAGGRAVPFLTLLNPLRRRLQINLRNHRKIVVIDGRVGFTGGLNIGDEYVGKVARFGEWRDSFLRVEGSAAAGLQRVFGEDWDFSASEEFDGPEYYPALPSAGGDAVQIAWSGPDQEPKAIREVYFAAIMRARARVWIATPYFVPDAPLADALALAARSGRDVRIVVPFRPDKWIPLMASRFLWQTLLEAGVRIFQYTPGFIHAKLLTVDGEWASVGSPNFDNRSLHLNFEVTALLHSPRLAEEVEAALTSDMARSIELNTETFHNRPFIAKMAENAARLASPIL